MTESVSFEPGDVVTPTNDQGHIMTVVEVEPSHGWIRVADEGGKRNRVPCGECGQMKSLPAPRSAWLDPRAWQHFKG